MKEMEHEEMKEMVAAYVLGAIPNEEVPFVRAHILSCEECMAEADSYMDTAGAIALAADPVDLPAGFTDRVVAAATGRADVEIKLDEAEASRPKKRWLPRFDRWQPLTAAAAIVAILVGSIGVYSAISTGDRLDRTEAVLTALLHGEKGSFALTGTDGAVARVVPTFDGAYLIAAGLREAPARHDYQLWLMKDGQPVSAGLFDGSDDISIVTTQADLGQFDGAAITIEPDGGSSQPTTEPILTSA